MFIGEYQASIDEKGRISIPAKFRSQLKAKVVVTRGLDNSLFLYTAEEWKKLAEKLASLPISTANTRAFSRLMLAGAMDCDLDKQGREVGINRDCALLAFGWPPGYHCSNWREW